MNEEPLILAIGVDSELYHALALRLKPCGYGLRSAFSARDALNSLKDHLTGLAVLNIQLPDAHGLCLLSMMRQLYPHLPVLVLSEDDSTEVMIKALRLGAKAYLLSPVDLEQLLYCIHETDKQRGKFPRQRLGRVRPRRIYRGILNEVEEEL